MKHYLMLLPFCILAGQAQDIQWEKSYGGRQADYLYDVQPTSDYGFIIAGSSLSSKSGNQTQQANGDLDYYIWKMDEHGEEEWQKSFGGSGTDLLQSIQCTSDGGFILGGTSSSEKGLGKTTEAFGGNDYWIIKLNARGEEEWQRSFGGSGQDDFVSIVPAIDGYLIAGTSASSPDAQNKEMKLQEGYKKEISRGNMDYWIVKVDLEGKEQWQKTFGGEYADMLKAIAITYDGGYIVGGYSNSPSNEIAQRSDKTDSNFGKGSDYWVLKLDKNGEIEWQRTIGGDKDDQLFTLRQTYDNGYILGGNSNSDATGNKTQTNKEGCDFWIVKLQEDGSTDWQKTYDFGKADILTSVIENEDHSFLIGGFAQSEKAKDSGGINDYIALKISEKGEKLWDKSVGSDGEDILRKAIETRDGGYLLAGTSNPERIKKTTSNGKIKGLDANGQLAGAQRAQQTIDSAVNNTTASVNDTYKEKLNTATGNATKALNQDDDSRLKVGFGQAGNILDTKKGGSSKNNAIQQKGPKPGLGASKDKKTNFGGNDFWVVKLKDKDKKEKDPKSIEAFPNPAKTFTNVIVGFDFDKGTAEVYDLSGRQLQSFKIDSRTVPVNLTSYPEGIYIVKVSTNKGDASLKIIKGIN